MWIERRKVQVQHTLKFYGLERGKEGTPGCQVIPDGYIILC